MFAVSFVFRNFEKPKNKKGMKHIVVKKKSHAYALAKAIVRKACGARRLTYLTQEADITVDCGCGQTQGIYVADYDKAGNLHSATVGICKACGDNEQSFKI